LDSEEAINKLVADLRGEVEGLWDSGITNPKIMTAADFVVM
jgi:hypothetical protein